jgi:hypothetical protein
MGAGASLKKDERWEKCENGGRSPDTVNPGVATHIPGNSFFVFKTLVLMVIAVNLQDRIICGHLRAILHFKVLDHFPYQAHDGAYSHC